MASYDYIVVGSGSAGAAVAGRLSEDPDVTVLLVEAGAARKPMSVKVPAAFPTQFKTKLDWEVYTEPEPHLDGRVIYHPRSKLLGGCSGMNAMIYIRGNRSRCSSARRPTHAGPVSTTAPRDRCSSRTSATPTRSARPWSRRWWPRACRATPTSTASSRRVPGTTR